MTRRSLELTRTLREGKREGSLLQVIDRTGTPMGARLLADWLTSPLTSPELIAERHEAVAELLRRVGLRGDLRELARPGVRPGTAGRPGRHRPGDAPRPGRPGQDAGAPAQAQGPAHGPGLEAAERARSRARALPRGPRRDRGRPGRRPAAGRQGRRPDPRRLSCRASTSCASSPAAASRGSPGSRPSRSAGPGSTSLKVGFNKVFGYYIEITHAQAQARGAKFPTDYIRKQTVKNAERYITPELKEYEDKVLRAEDRACELEYELFTTLRDRVAAEAPRLIQAGAVLAQVDVLCGLAELAARHGYCRPEIVAEPVFEVEAGRHPVLDAILPPGDFVPNDIQLGPDDGPILLITGPNMAGKSTYIRQVALIAILAQMGSFVPARRARIGVVDRLFARVGATDELSRGQSTFMVEMTETANILNNATPRSLVILDEIGRGTSTFDGISLAWAITEHIHDAIGCRTLFATHYHELVELEKTKPRLRNANVAVRESDGEIVFLTGSCPAGPTRATASTSPGWPACPPRSWTGPARSSRSSRSSTAPTPACPKGRSAARSRPAGPCRQPVRRPARPAAGRAPPGRSRRA